jgi:hypothetical protein
LGAFTAVFSAQASLVRPSMRLFRLHVRFFGASMKSIGFLMKLRSAPGSLIYVCRKSILFWVSCQEICLPVQVGCIREDVGRKV